jgi:alkylation response protein AidB-like acyl-CoA dehydrogenase
VRSGHAATNYRSDTLRVGIHDRPEDALLAQPIEAKRPRDRLPSAAVAAETVADAYRRDAAETDRAGFIPPISIRALADAGLLAAVLPGELGGFGLGTDPGSTGGLLEILTIIGSGDLSIGRLYEGHVNALLLIQRHGTRAQLDRTIHEIQRDNSLFGVWNTDARSPLTLVPAAGGWRLVGGKGFASGAGLVEQALVTARLPEGGRQMLVIPMASLDDRIDRSVWHPLGMRASMSFAVDLTGVEVPEEALLGRPDDYLSEPWFSAGCLRFLAVQLGGALALLRIVHEHLRRTGREGDPYQIERFARMRVALEGGRLWLDHAAGLFDRADAEANSARIIATANMARHAVETACGLILDLAAKSVGVQGMLAPHPLERLIRDLTTYLRQPVPDAALASVGEEALAAGVLPW